MKLEVSEINITPIKPVSGLVAFASCVVYESLYLGSIGIYTRLGGGYRLTFPTKTVGEKQLNIFHPINKTFGEYLEKVITEKYEEVMNKNNDRYSST